LPGRLGFAAERARPGEICNAAVLHLAEGNPVAALVGSVLVIVSLAAPSASACFRWRRS
jgi:hypothetical protein